MRFEALITKVQQAEQALEASERTTVAQWEQLKQQWVSSWTPARIVVAGLVSGFMVGRARPLRAASGGGVLQMITALSGLFAGSSAHAAANEAEHAADTAERTAAAVAPEAMASAAANIPSNFP